MVLHEPGAAGDAPTRIGPPPAPSSAEASAVRPLNVPLLCWHESACSARTDPLVALAEEAGFIATDRPLPVGTPVFLELSLGHASNAARAQIDAVVVSGDAPVEMAGFNVRFVDVDPAVLTWIGRHLESAAQKRSAPARVVEEPPSPPPPRETAPETVQEPAPETAAATADDDDLPELVDFEELGVREAEPEGAASAAAPGDAPPSLDREVEAALGDFSADDALAVEDAFSSSFSPWVDLPEAEADDAAPLALAREPEAPLAALPEPPAAAPPEPPAAAPPEPPAAALPEPPAAALSAKEPEVFDPFADTDEPDAPAPEAAAPLASDEFVERSGDDVEVDVFDDGFEDAPAAFAPGAAPGLAEAGVGFSNPFARGAGGPAPDDEIGDTDATREELPRALPERDPPIAETLPWGLDRRTVLEAAEARAEGFPAPTAQASPSPVLPPPAPPAPGGLAPPAPAPTGLAPPLAGGSEEPSSPGVPSAPSAAPFGKATPEGVTPIFGTRPPSGLFRAPEAPAAPPAPSAPLPSPPSGPPSAPEPTFVSTAPYSVAPGPSPDPAPGLGAAPGGPSAATPLEQLQRFPETQRFGVAPGGPPVGGGFPGSPAPTPAPLPSPPPAAAPAGVLAAGAGPLEETERYRIGGPAPGTPAPAPGAPAAAPGAPGAPFRTPTLEFPQPGPADGPAAAPPRPHTATLREFAAVNAPPSAPTAAVPPAAPAAVTAAVPSPSADEVTGAMPLAPGPRSLQVPAPEDDIVEVSTTSQIVRAGEGGLEALVAKDRAARLDLPMQSVTGGRDAFTVSSEAFPDAGADLDPFADLDVGPPPALPSAPAPAAAQAQAEPDIWYPGDPPRTPEQGPPTGVYGAAAERPAEAWQVRGPASQPTSPAPGEPDELPLVAGVVVLEEELPLVEARPLEEEPPANEPWVIGGPGRDGPKR